jgi:UDP-N-acetylglucosamine 2-epimerase (non-hydrolysing)
LKVSRILCVFGTRPEAIKFAPLIRELKRHPESFEVITCITAQHRSMLDQVLSFFEIHPDYDLNVMAPNQSLFDIIAKVMPGLETVIDRAKPDLIIVQGDTTTAFLGALAGYYARIPIAHLEAGLRSGNKYAPWPEELNRVMTGHLGDLHFAPTPRAEKNLRTENIHEHIYITGNTVIDALHLALKLIDERGTDFTSEFSDIDFTKRIILLTAHRRESFGKPFEDLCAAVREIAQAHPEVQIVYPVHLNPNVREPVFNALSGNPNITLIDPVDYPRLIWLLNKSYFVLTDSGGIQEEAPALGKPVLVLREVTERQEGVEAGNAILVGTDRALIVQHAHALLTDPDRYQEMSSAINPYGDGTASAQIAGILKTHLPEIYV